jgi:hypothetical protein
MTHTRYSTTNILLLSAGALVSLFSTFLVSLTAGFASDSVRDFKSLAQASFLWFAILTLPTYLVTLRWIQIGSAAMWIIAVTCLLIALSSSIFLRLGGEVLLLFVNAFIFRAVYAGSRTEVASNSTTPP